MIERMTAAEFRAMSGKRAREPRIKGAVRTWVDGRTFDSALEAARYAQLILLQKAGEISDLQCQVRIPLEGAAGAVLTPKGRQMHYVADFTYRDATGAVIEDAKGFRTEQYRLKKAILNAMGYEIREIERPAKTRSSRRKSK